MKTILSKSKRATAVLLAVVMLVGVMVIPVSADNASFTVPPRVQAMYRIQTGGHDHTLTILPPNPPITVTPYDVTVVVRQQNGIIQTIIIPSNTLPFRTIFSQLNLTAGDVITISHNSPTATLSVVIS